MNKENILELITKSSIEVMNKAKHIKINYDKLEEFIKNNKIEAKMWGTSNIYNFMDRDTETIIHFLLVFQAIDFCFWGNPKWSIKNEEETIDGSRALMYLIIKNIDIFTDFKKLEELTYEEFKKIFTSNTEIPLLKERYEILHDIAKVINTKMQGSFYKFIKDIHSDIELFHLIIEYFPSFKDERIYNNKPVYFYKLACLLVSDIMHARNIIEGNNFDYSHLPGCTDYKIPQIIRAFGITKYSDELESIINKKEEIPFNSEYEIEIRSSAIVVINYIIKKTGLSGMAINDFLWVSSGKIKNMQPYHLTKTTTY